MMLAKLKTLLRRKTWKERGETRGRAKAEPEGTLHIKVTRADGTVEDHGTVPAHRSK